MWILTSRIRPAIGLFLFMLVSSALAQENTQKRVPRSLLECYREPKLLDRDSRLPATLTTLLDLIRKVESDPNTQFSLRDLTIGLLHRFRVDGILKAPGVSSSPSIVPFSTTGPQFPKHAVIFSRLLPGSGKPFPNETLSDLERCSMHFMLSSTIETQIRGDEQNRCGSLSQYRSLRLPRQADMRPKKQFRDKENFDYEDFGAEQVGGDKISQCPVESGVMRTKWGSVAVGPLLAGIAAGLERQSVQVRTLLSLARSTPKTGNQAQPGTTQGASAVDNLFAATLTGDIAEAALFQAHESRVEVGSSGAWNSTNIPRWYFLSKKFNNEMTDAEIRGDLDGLILGTLVKQWSDQVSTLKLSQLLDMYYSQRGVFSSNYKACSRREKLVEVAPAVELEKQTIAFTSVLEREIVLQISISPEGIAKKASEGANALMTYIPRSLNDLSCQATATNQGRDNIPEVGLATDVYIILDTSWRYHDIVQVLALILDGLDARPFGSTFTVLNAKDLSVIVNTTHYSTDFHSQFNESTYRTHPQGFDIQRILTEFKPILYSSLDYDHANNIAGGRSQVALLIPNSASPTEADFNFAKEHLQIINEEVPDLRFLFLAGGGAVSRFSELVREPNKDLFSLSTTTQNFAHLINQVLDRIRQTPRRIINHHCNSKWEGDGQGGVQLGDYVEPSGINYYRLHPNYFFENAERKVRVQGHGYGTLTVCYSRNVENPVANATINSDENNDVNCRQITSETIDIELKNPCESSYLIRECSPLYISVAAPPTTSNGNYRCIEKECKAPDNLRVSFNTENLGCYSGVSCIIGSLSLIITLLFIQLV